MKPWLIIMTLFPVTGFAQPINTMNNPNLPDYQNPSMQRMQTQMQTQQIQRQGMLHQQLQSQTQIQQQHWQNQMNTHAQQIQQSRSATIPVHPSGHNQAE
ncbi:DUF2756 domain-containing protein [Salmonella enterica]|nr:DUF2756 domain-containing protein [Salmonella enterica]ECB2072321.1 DUF2756 domain-containing protein [Salmonella enterica subsp. enterica serovar Benin]EBE6989368.1 DUF2756 domain-containing protein [Salmonella enterica]EBE7299745.1 DUF2756 domain-containing protein [Salmonella enterica]EEO5753472.1 DUF2756 domain-containing protein [Salmonella enterica]